MAPKRGLAASRKSGPVDPPAAPVERTYPLDEDALTLSDLFELRLSALASPSPDDARGLLRGILHGTQSLLCLPQSASSESLRTALGLDCPRAPSKLSYLTAFGLHEMSSLPPIPILPIRGGKKAKIDLREPTSPAEWLDEAIPHYDAALASLPSSPPTDAETMHWSTLVRSDAARARADRAGWAIRNGERPSTDGIAEELARAGESWHEYAAPEGDAPWEDELGSPRKALLSALAAFLAVVDGRSVRELSSINSVLALLDRGDDRSQLEADVALAEFGMLADAVEDKYRPADDDDDDDDEGEVVPLPDQSDVRAAKEVGAIGQSSLLLDEWGVS